MPPMLIPAITEHSWSVVIQLKFGANEIWGCYDSLREFYRGSCCWIWISRGILDVKSALGVRYAVIGFLGICWAGLAPATNPQSAPQGCKCASRRRIGNKRAVRKDVLRCHCGTWQKTCQHASAGLQANSTPGYNLKVWWSTRCWCVHGLHWRSFSGSSLWEVWWHEGSMVWCRIFSVLHILIGAYHRSTVGTVRHITNVV